MYAASFARTCVGSTRMLSESLGCSARIACKRGTMPLTIAWLAAGSSVRKSSSDFLSSASASTIVPVHLDDRERRLGAKLGVGIALATDDRREPGRALDGVLPTLDVVAVDLAAGRQQRRGRAEHDDLGLPTHPTRGAIPLRALQPARIIEDSPRGSRSSNARDFLTNRAPGA